MLPFRILLVQFSSAVAFAVISISVSNSIAAEPVLLDDQFELPASFHIYRAAQPALTGGSYDLTLDGQGRLLVAEGNSVRRLMDDDNDGVYDSQETIADGPALKGRGPQGLLVYGDNLLAVAGDGVQLLSGYNSGGKVKHERRLGESFSTGGDHAAHTIRRGLDGYIYLVTGDGAGSGGRRHTTEDSSPVLEERNASVFRFDPTGEKWECVGSGGRNPPSLGMNYLGELFSFDSDMEFHVDVPFYRPVRLNHWATGGDQGWQQVGAYPPHYIDCLPGVLEVGRGSPTSGIFYEHTQLPQKYRDSFIVCDYRWKSATSGAYASSGRLVAFHLKRNQGTWQAELTELAKVKPSGKDENGNAINFAVVDADVAPDGSLLITDHNQGVWRIFYDAAKNPAIPPLVPKWNPPALEKNAHLRALLTLPQPAAEWSRLRELAIMNTATYQVDAALRHAALDASLPVRMRLRAVRLLAPEFADLPAEFVEKLSKSEATEIRGQAAWLTGIRGLGEHDLLIGLLDDPEPFVRRRAADALSRLASPSADAKLIERLGDPDRFVRYAAMTALAHRPTNEIITIGSKNDQPQILMRLLVAAHLRKQRPDAEVTIEFANRLLKSSNRNNEDETDLLRVLSLYKNEIASNADCLQLATSHLLKSYPHTNPTVRWEQTRLLGSYRIATAFPELVNQLVNEKDYVTQFHIASTLADIPAVETGWDKSARDRLANWLISNQTGWFGEFGGKGLQFPGFWGTVVNKLGEKHAEVLVTKLDQLKPDSQLARISLSKLDLAPNADAILIEHYLKAADNNARRNVLVTLQRVNTAKAANFIVEQHAKTAGEKTPDAELQKALLIALATKANFINRPRVFLNSLFESDDQAIVDACALGLVTTGKTLQAIKWEVNSPIAGLKVDQSIYFRLLELMERHPNNVVQLEHALTVLSGHTPTKVNSHPRCIWSSTAQEDGDNTWFARSFEISGKVKRGELIITCDNEFEAYINGKRVAASANWQKPLRVDITAALQSNENLIAIAGKNIDGPAGLVATVSWTTDDKKTGRIVTDPKWRYTKIPPKDWQVHGTAKGNWNFSIDVTAPTRNAIAAFSSFTGISANGDPLAVQEYWHKWYLQQYKTAFVARPLAQLAQRPDEELHKLVANLQEIKGDLVKGRGLYLKAGCYACHGGIEDRKTTIFGPALNGVTLRLKRIELADAIVYPSKQVVERFKASVLITTSGKQYSGFITEQSDDFVSITDIQNKITRVPRVKVDSIELQKTSLMPKRLLGTFTDEQVRDIMAFLQSLK